MGIVFLIYSIFHAYSATIGSIGTTDDDLEVPTDFVTPGDALLYSTSSGDGDFSTTEAQGTTPTPPKHHVHPTWRPRRENCTPPAIEQFPRPLMSPNVRRHGGLVIHVLVAVFSFLGLAIVCDDYFVSSLDRLCEGELKTIETSQVLPHKVKEVH